MEKNDKSVITVYHGSRLTVLKPDISYSRSDIDFGVGFYLTEDEHMAKKWACNKNTSVLNKYELNLTGLNVYHFKADEVWLDYCVANRSMETPDFRDDSYDIIIGPTADDNLFNTLDMYADGLLSSNDAVKIINCMNYSKQIVIKNQKTIDSNLRIVGSHEMKGLEKQHFIELINQDKKEAYSRSEKLIKAVKRGR